MEFRANPNLLDAQSSGSPRGIAARQRHVAMVNLLLENGADRSLPTENALTWVRPWKALNTFWPITKFGLVAVVPQTKVNSQVHEILERSVWEIIALLAGSAGWRAIPLERK